MALVIVCPTLDAEVTCNDVTWDSDTQECELCGSHGEVTATVKCECGEHHDITLYSW